MQCFQGREFTNNYSSLDPEPISAIWMMVAFQQDSLKNYLLETLHLGIRNDSTSSGPYDQGLYCTYDRPDSDFPIPYKGEVTKVKGTDYVGLLLRMGGATPVLPIILLNNSSVIDVISFADHYSRAGTHKIEVSKNIILRHESIS